MRIHHSPPIVLTGATLLLALVAGLAPLRGQQPMAGSAWSAPESLGPDVNSAFEDLAPHITSDGRALYFSSTRPGAGGEDLWVSRRASRHEPWGAAANLGDAINTAANERSPALSRNRRLLFFATDRPGGAGGLDIWLSWRPDPDDDFGWQPPVNLGTGINSTATDAGPSFLESSGLWPLRAAIPELYMASARPGGPGGLDLYLGAVPGGWDGPPTPIAALNSPQNDLTPTVRRDGLEIIFASARPGGAGGIDLWHAFRWSPHLPWSTPANLGSIVNSTAIDVFPSLSFDGRTLVFQSSRPGGLGGSDLYVSTR